VSDPTSGPQPVPPPQHSYPQASYPPPIGQQPYQPAPGGQQAPEPIPSAQTKRTGLIAAIVAGGVLLILIIAGAVFFATQSSAHAPQKAVDAYMQAVVHGNVKQALQLGGVRATPSDVLLTDAAYRAASDHITHYSLTGSVVNGDGAAVRAVITQGSQRFTQSFALVKDGKDMLFFDRWKLKPIALGTARVELEAPSDAAVTVGKTTVKHDSDTINLRALPGTYPVAMTSSGGLYDAKGSSAEVIGFAASASRPAQLTATLTAAGMQAASDAVNTYIDGCAASTEFRPDGCPFGTVGEDDGYSYSAQKWTVDPRPEFSIGAWSAGGWAVTTTTPGAASFSANIADGAGGTGTATAGPLAFYVGGYISKVDGSGATFVPLIADTPTA